MIEKAQARAKTEETENEIDLYERMEDRLLHKEEKRQKNIDGLVEVPYSKEELEKEEKRLEKEAAQLKSKEEQEKMKAEQEQKERLAEKKD